MIDTSVSFVAVVAYRFVDIQLAASTSSGRASAVGMLQAILQVMLQGPRS
jgi:hypothetical protein